MTKTETEQFEHIQFRIPKAKLDAFNALVYERYGMKHGGKTKMFLDLIAEHQTSQRITLLKAEIERLEKQRQDKHAL
ncbi:MULTISPECIES: DUF1192 family protein [unclassified Ruegeria]|uniref:DUF1192 family protein n=1 Tax=unclassified Ruegeria TaxID=2625375 RepID=UPI0014899198|nr:MULTISPECIES: DUF1192 family protein [unclassified Ruegeria]